MCTECQRMITLEPCKVIFEGIDILIQSISHRRIFITNIHGTISYLVNSDRWSWLTRSTRITNTNVRYTCLIAQVWRDAALQLCCERMSLRCEIIQVVGSIQCSNTTQAERLLSIYIAPTNRELIELVDIPIQLQTSFLALHVLILICP